MNTKDLKAYEEMKNNLINDYFEFFDGTYGECDGEIIEHIEHFFLITADCFFDGDIYKAYEWLTNKESISENEISKLTSFVDADWAIAEILWLLLFQKRLEEEFLLMQLEKQNCTKLMGYFG